jgi:hypothetical protein
MPRSARNVLATSREVPAFRVLPKRRLRYGERVIVSLRSVAFSLLTSLLTLVSTLGCAGRPPAVTEVNRTSSRTADGHLIFGGGGCFHPVASAASGAERSMRFAARLIDGAGWGVSLGGEGDGTSPRGITLIYTAGVRRLYLVQYPDGKQRLAAPSPGEVADGWPEFRVVRTRQLFLVWMDGQLVVAFEDSGYAGTTGFWTRGGHVEVRDLVVDAPTAAELATFSGLPRGWATAASAEPQREAVAAPEESGSDDGTTDGGEAPKFCDDTLGGLVRERKDLGFFLPEAFADNSRKAELAFECANGLEVWGFYERPGASDSSALMIFRYQPKAKLQLTQKGETWNGFKIVLKPNVLVALLSSKSTLIASGAFGPDELKAFAAAAEPKTLESRARAKLGK